MAFTVQILFVPLRRFSLSYPNCKIVPKNLKGKSKTAQDWLTRQLRDPYVEKAKMENYRSRSAFKLLEMNSKHSLLSPGMVVVDCGAAPGGWTQVAVTKVNSLPHDVNSAQGKVIAIDRCPIYPIPGATILGGCDFIVEESQERLNTALEGSLVDAVLSDMAPNASGIRFVDHDAILNLAVAASRFAIKRSKKGGFLLIKVLDGSSLHQLETQLKSFYSSVRRVKPPASRSDSTELYILAQDFKHSRQPSMSDI